MSIGRLRRLLPALLLLVALDALAAAGRFDSLGGTVHVTARDGVRRPAAPEMAVDNGDRLETGADGWAIVEMADGGTLTLRPRTTLVIEDYDYRGADDGTEKSIFSLLRGAFRSITGAIGRSAPYNYQIKTPTATIGVRGTDHEPAHIPEDEAEFYPGQRPGTYDRVNKGETFLSTLRGEVRVRPGETAFGDFLAQLAPKRLAKPPKFYDKHVELDRKLADKLTKVRVKHEDKLRKLDQKLAKTRPERQKKVREQQLKREQQRIEWQQQQREKKQRDAQERRERDEAKQKERKDKLKQEREQRKREADELRERDKAKATQRNEQLEQQREQRKREADELRGRSGKDVREPRNADRARDGQKKREAKELRDEQRSRAEPKQRPPKERRDGERNGDPRERRDMRDRDKAPKRPDKRDKDGRLEQRRIDRSARSEKASFEPRGGDRRREKRSADPRRRGP